MMDDLNDTKELRKLRERIAGLEHKNHELAESLKHYKKESTLLRTLLDHVPDYVFVKDLEGRFILNNLAHAEAMGTSKTGEVNGKTDFDYFPQELAQKFFHDDMVVIKSGKSIHDRLEQVVDRDTGEMKWASATKVPLKDEKGGIVGLVGVVRDITDRKRQEDELNIFREKMVQTEHLVSLGTVSATVAHELNQPLTAIRLFLQQSMRQLKKIECPDIVKDRLGECLNEVSNALSIINRFRNVPLRPSKHIMTDFYLEEIAERIIAVLAESARRAKLRLSTDNLDALPQMHGSVADIEQLFFIIIQNAIQAADGKKWRRLNINARLNGDEVQLSFSDTCGGIAPEHVDKIFEPFFTTKPRGQGTGLGLPIIKKIVTQWGKDVWAETKLGDGTVFHVTLPRRVD